MSWAIDDGGILDECVDAAVPIGEGGNSIMGSCLVGSLVVVVVVVVVGVN